MAELNLIPYSIKEKRRKIFLYRQYISLGIIVFSLLFFGVYFPQNTLSGLKIKAEALKHQIATYDNMIKTGEKINSDIDKLSQFIDKVNVLTSDKVIVTDKIRGLEAFIPQDIILNSINYSDNLISIQGVASNYSSIAELAANLQMSENYRGAKIYNISFDKTNNIYTFSLSIK